MSITCPLISTSPYQTTSCVLSASWSLSLDSCIGSCQQPRCLMDGDPSVLHVQTVPQVDAACRDETSATTKLAAGGWADRRQCVLISQRALRLIYFSDMRRRDRKQQQLCLFLSERLLWGFEVISWTASVCQKQWPVQTWASLQVHKVTGFRGQMYLQGHRCTPSACNTPGIAEELSCYIAGENAKQNNILTSCWV